MSVAAEKRVESAGLIPAGEEFLGWVTKEAPYVGTGKGHTGDALGEEHGKCLRKVLPVGLVVAGPHCGRALGAGKVGPGQHKWAALFARAKTGFKSFEGRVVESHAVEVVHITVLPVAVVEVIFRHGGLRAVEDGGLVHIVPYPGIRAGANELFKVEEGLPPGLCSGVEAINPVGRAGPAPAFIDLLSGFVHDAETFVDELVADGVVLVVLDVWVDDCDELRFISNHLVVVLGGREFYLTVTFG